MSEKCVMSLGQLAVLVSNISAIEFILVLVIEIRISSYAYSTHLQMSVKNGTNFTHVFFFFDRSNTLYFFEKF